MTQHFHHCDLWPTEQFWNLRGANLLLNFLYPAHAARAHQIAQCVLIDSGAFGVWKSGKTVDEAGYYKFCERWLHWPTTCAIPLDAIDEPSQIQDGLLNRWPHGKAQAWPVWHISEPDYRLFRLIDDGWPRICFGSTGEYADVLSDPWQRRIDGIWNAIIQTYGRVKPIHMLRGLACSGMRWPFASVDSSDVAKNYHRPQNSVRGMVERWDAIQCPGTWAVRAEQEELL